MPTGRPTLPDPARRSAHLGVRLTPGELSELQRDAELAQCCVTDLARARIAGGRIPVRQSIPALNQQAWESLARTTANLNQLLSFLNGASPVGPDTATTLTDLARTVAEVRLHLVGAQP